MPIPTVPAKISKFPELALLCLREDRRHYFACSEDRRRLGNESKKLRLLLCISLNLHYFAFGEDRRRLGNENKKLRILFCISLNLHYLC